MEPGRFPARTRTAVTSRPHPDSLNRDEVITIDLSVEASAALGPQPLNPSFRDLPEALRGMYYTG
jgi:hypothetical protein